MNNEDVSIDGNGLDSRISPRVSASAQEREPKFSFVMIVLNGMPFIEYSLKSVYDFAYEIIIVEGAVENCMFAANPDGSSTDGTVEFIKSFPDPQEKIRLVRGRWPEKCEMQNEALRHVCGDYIWLIDPVEVYRRQDLTRVRQILAADDSVTQIDFIAEMFWKVLDYVIVSDDLHSKRNHCPRVFKYFKGATFDRESFLRVLELNSSAGAMPVNRLDGFEMRRNGVVIFNYTFVSHAQVDLWIEKCLRLGLDRERGIDLIQWRNECFRKWMHANREEVESYYPVWIEDKNSHTELFDGIHPEVMMDYVRNYDLYGRLYEKPVGMQNVIDAANEVKEKFPSDHIEVIETGTIRFYHESGQSTRYISEVLGEAGRITTIDISPYSIMVSKQVCRNASNVEWILSDSVAHLKSMKNRRFHMAFLDSVNDKDVIFEEFKLLIPMMLTGGVILIDDAGIVLDGSRIDTGTAAQKGHRVWEFLNKCGAEFTVPTMPRSQITQLKVVLHQENLRRINDGLNGLENLAQKTPNKFSFVMIALNAMPFIEYSLKSVYDFAHEIIIVEGAVENCMFAANPDGSSTDGTVEFIKSFADPQEKIRLVQGRWPEKCEMQNEALKYVTGDYVWLIDSDEVYRSQDLEKIKEILKSDSSITQVNFIPNSFWKGPDHIVYSSKFFEFSNHFRRLFKFVPGAVFISHRPPTMVWPGCNRTTEQMHLLGGAATREMGVVLYHYNYVLDSQVKQKNDYYGRMDKKDDFWGFDRQAWYKECFLKWNPQNREQIERRYPVWLGDEHSHTQPFTGTHPDVMSNFIAGFRRKVLAGSGTKRPCQPVVKASKKNGLLSYITAPLRMGPDYQRFMFSNAGIARSMVSVLAEMGYIVDLIDWNCMDFESDKAYDLFIGHAGANWEYLSRNVVGDAVKIYFATGIYWRQFNRREAERFDRLEERRGVRLPYDRRIEFSEEFAVHDADGIICLGNKNAAASYDQFPVCFKLNNACYGDDHYDAAAKDFDAGRRHFLYFGSGGNIHKGLGLLVEAFMQLDAELWCAGPVEPGFADVYKEALPKHPNIHFVSWVELRSPRFYELMNLCNSTIFVSCAEGSPGGVIECMNQGLIPIVNREANIDVDDFGIMLQDDSIEHIVRVVCEVMAKPAQWHYEHSVRTRRAALHDYSEQAFRRNMRLGIERVISQSQQVRTERDGVASQATVDSECFSDRYRNDLGALLRGADRLKSHARHNEAAQLWQRALVVEPSCMTAMCELAAYYADKGQSDKARGIAKRVMKLCPLDEQCRAVFRQTESTSSCYVVSNSLRTSIAVPCEWHHVRYLDNALSKIAGGTEVPDEVVIVVSPVEGQEHLDRLNRLYEKFKDIFALEIKWCEQVLDAASAREALTESLSGDVILYHDADDTQHPQRLEIVRRFFNEYDIVHLCHSYRTFSEGEAGKIVYDNIQTSPSQELYEKYFVQGPMPKAFGAGFTRTHAGALCIRREVLQKVTWAGLVQGVEGREFCLNVLKTFNKSILIDAPLLNYNTSDERKMDIETNDIRIMSKLQPMA